MLLGPWFPLNVRDFTTIVWLNCVRTLYLYRNTQAALMLFRVSSSKVVILIMFALRLEMMKKKLILIQGDMTPCFTFGSLVVILLLQLHSILSLSFSLNRNTQAARILAFGRSGEERNQLHLLVIFKFRPLLFLLFSSFETS